MKPRTKGIDVAKYQGSIDWGRVHAEGIEFAFARVTDGLEEIDPYFGRNWIRMREAGVVCGAYHFFRAKLDPVKQAELFVDLVNAAGGFERDDLPPVLDVEQIGCRGVSPHLIVKNMKAWIEVVERLTRKRVIIYTNADQWNALAKAGGRDAVFAKRMLWTSHYQTTDPLVPLPWMRWHFWQYTGKGGVRGITGKVCEDLFDGTLPDLLVVVEEGNLDPPAITDERTTDDIADAVETLEENNAPPDDDGFYWVEPVKPRERAELPTVPDSPSTPAKPRHGAVAWVVAVFWWVVSFFTWNRR
jgi:lysozyme